MALCAGVYAAVVTAQVPAPSPPRTAPNPSSGSPSGLPPQKAVPGNTPDDDFIEFLGADDVGDAAWWEFLKKSEPQKERVVAPPPDAKQ